jgi:hypothetical protein
MEGSRRKICRSGRTSVDDRVGVVYAFWSSNVSRKVIRALSFVDVRGFGTVERRKCAADGLWKEYRLNSL